MKLKERPGSTEGAAHGGRRSMGAEPRGRRPPSRSAGSALPTGAVPKPAVRGYKPIGDYGVIGNLQTVALVGTDGSIDWCCMPHFDSPSVFAAILDTDRGGRFQICPTEPGARKQLYLPDTNVLVTRFLTAQGVAEVTDFMPMCPERKLLHRHSVIRRVGVIRGEVPFRLVCCPRLDYARETPEVRQARAGVVFDGEGLSLSLSSQVPLVPRDGGVTADFRLKEGTSVAFDLECLTAAGSQAPRQLGTEGFEAALGETVKFWREWVAKSRYRGRWREVVTRSALTLKLLTFEPTGAIVAAPTCGLPEMVGGSRNWDYRYAWIRDAAFTVYAFLRLGYREEAHAFMRWLLARTADLEPNGSLHPMYRIEGGHELPEQTLAHLEGYRQSRPVRIGNSAVDQFQLDMYGALMDAVYLYNKYGAPIAYDLWVKLRRIIDWLTEHWRSPDHAIWEVRSGPQRFVYSTMMCWVALDRAIRIAEKRGFPADLERWRKTRDTIYEEVMRHGWDEARGSFVQFYGSRALYASALLMPLVFFVSPLDPRMARTLDAIRRELVYDSLVRRYSLQETEDGLPGDEGTFTLCSFWLVEALTRAGQLEDARLTFEKMLGYANHLGLYSEEIDTTGAQLGNYPQALTHLALISAAVNLDRALGDRAR